MFRTIRLEQVAMIGRQDDDRIYIRKTVVALLLVPTGEYIGEEPVTTPIEIIAVKPGSFAISADRELIHNIGAKWIIQYHIRTYKDAH